MGPARLARIGQLAFPERYARRASYARPRCPGRPGRPGQLADLGSRSPGCRWSASLCQRRARQHRSQSPTTPSSSTHDPVGPSRAPFLSPCAPAPRALFHVKPKPRRRLLGTRQAPARGSPRGLLGVSSARFSPWPPRRLQRRFFPWPSGQLLRWSSRRQAPPPPRDVPAPRHRQRGPPGAAYRPVGHSPHGRALAAASSCSAALSHPRWTPRQHADDPAICTRVACGAHNRHQVSRETWDSWLSAAAGQPADARPGSPTSSSDIGRARWLDFVEDNSHRDVE